MRLEAVTLDAAGTLIAVAEPVGQTYARFAARHGITLAPDRAERDFAAALAAAAPLAFPGADAARLANDERAWWRAVVHHTFGPVADHVSFDPTFSELFAHYGRPQAWRVFPEVPETLRLLRARGLRLAVVSNFDQRLVSVLAGLGLTRLVDLVVHSSAEPVAKPHPGIFLRALASLGAPPRAALHAGDGLLADVEGARRAGMHAVLVDRSAAHPLPPAGVIRITTLAELAAVISSI